MTRERWNSEPDLKTRMDPVLQKEKGNWIQRHLSFKKKKRGGSGSEGGGEDSPKSPIPLEQEQRTSSSPQLSEEAMARADDSLSACQQAARRPSCLDGVVTTVPQLRRAPAGAGRSNHNKKRICALAEEPPDVEPPTILATDYDLEKENSRLSD